MTGLVLAALLASAAAQLSDAIEGAWTNKAGTVVIEIAPCVAAAGWCGTVISASPEAAADARRGGTDPLVGTQLLHGFQSVAPGKWRGTVFVPDLNKRSRAELRAVDGDHLAVRGCAVGGLLCKSQVWTRVPKS